MKGNKMKQKQNIRRSTLNDLSRMLEIYDFARKQMRANGNPNQWIAYPSKNLLEEDIKTGVSYVIESNSNVCGTFVFSIGEDPTYQVIKNGSWLNGEPYGTIHRIASDGTQKGIFKTVEEFCFQQIQNVRVDTHEDNKIMQHLLEKSGFTKCGIIYTHDGSPRIAYQKKVY
jgi:RimJ/RimL family protein N-acetyltransferase